MNRHQHLFDLDGHVSVVTGGSQGIGLGLARGLIKANANVALWARRTEQLANAKEELQALNGGQIFTVLCDVSKECDVIQSIEKTLNHFGRLDSLFANAGISRGKPFLESTIEDYRSQNTVNFEGMFLCFREAAKQMISQGEGGKLVAITSIATVVGWPNLVSYSATKGAMEAAVLALAMELGPHGIQVNALLPGVFRTPMTATLDLEQHFLPHLPGNFIAGPEHMEGIAVFLASRASDYLTAARIRIDGGLSIAAP